MKKQFSFGTWICLVCVLVTSLALSQRFTQHGNLPFLAPVDDKVVSGVGTISSIDTESNNVTIKNTDGSKVKLSVTGKVDLQKVQTVAASALHIGDIASVADKTQQGSSFFVEGLIVSSTDPLRLMGGQDSRQIEETVVKTPFTVSSTQDKAPVEGELAQRQARQQVGTLTIFRGGVDYDSQLSRVTIDFSKTDGIWFNRVSTIEITDLAVGQNVMFAVRQVPNDVSHLIQLKVVSPRDKD